ncbi:hypothetical protein N7513_011683 [Penicillium frequentans]|nr:hypothetical protein N7513_011683 [Penicillium glabrum]
MTEKCVHKGCGKTFSDPEEDCVYHPGPPVFHEGQKGWKCCKPRVLTFEEFLAIAPCTTGKHSTVTEEPPAPAPAPVQVKTLPERPAITAIAPPTPPANPSPAEPDSDDPSLEIPANATCRRRGCGTTYTGSAARDDEKCVHHPGQPIFHEGSKGWTCCKRRVLEFDQFLKIPGCTEKTRHMFVGKPKPEGEEKVESVRNDFYQTVTSVNVSLYLKKIDKERASVKLAEKSITFDLPTSDNKRFQDTYSLFAPIDAEKSSFRVLGTKLELTLVKADGTSWPVLRSDDKWTGERIQIGNAGRA